MSIDISRHPNDIFADLLTKANPHLGTLTKDDLTIRRITDLNTFTYLPTYTHSPSRLLTNYPNVLGCLISTVEGIDKFYWVVRKWVYFNGNDVTIVARGDDSCTVYIDGVSVGATVNVSSEFTVTVPLTAGSHEVLIVIKEGVGNTYALMHMTDGTNSYETDDTWEGIKDDDIYPAFDLSKYISNTLKTSAEVDLIGHGSEVKNDYVEFTYGRVPVSALFNFIDTDIATDIVEMIYPASQSSMLTGSVNNFADVYDSWYRFSHKTDSPYPADPTELDGWSYIPEYDCIQSTENSSTYVGFISNDTTEDYEFSTVITAEDNDNDALSIVLAAYKQNDIDVNEHTLSVVVIRGTDTGPYAHLYYNYMQNTKGRTLLHNFYLPILPAVDIDRWRELYTHVYCKRVGDEFEIYVKVDYLPTDANKTRDENILDQIDICGEIKQGSLVSNGYKTFNLDASVTLPVFTGGVRYGYAQLSQANARFWNIRRPNDEGTLTSELKQYFLNDYGWNIGDYGIKVDNLGANKFSISVDNAVYKGTLELSPT